MLSLSLSRHLAAGALAGFMLLSPLPAAAQPAPAGFEELAEKLLPTVVNVSTTSKMTGPGLQTPPLPNMPPLPPGSPFEKFFKEFYDQYRTPPQQNDQRVSAVGSGFIIDAREGYVVTNNHVVKDAEEIKIILHDDTTLDATLVGSDDKTDIAVLKVKTEKPLTAAVFGDSDQSKVGSWIVAIGNPFGLGGTVTAGIVSARQRDINAGPYDDFIQTDASINRGNSGGPMFNLKGEVIGVNTAIFSPSGGSVGIGFAVPSNLVQPVVKQLIKYGQTRRGWLGVRIQEVTPDIAEGLGLGRARGALVSSPAEGGPAEKAGIETGDVILSFDGQDITTMRRLPRIVAETEVGRKVPVKIWRKGAEKTLTVELGELEKAEEITQQAKAPDTKSSTEKTVELPALGLGLAALTDALRETHGIPRETAGVAIVDVKPDSPAAERGLAAGDVVLEVDQKEVKTPEDVVKSTEAAQKAGRSSILFFVARKDDRRFVALKLGKP